MPHWRETTPRADAIRGTDDDEAGYAMGWTLSGLDARRDLGRLGVCDLTGTGPTAAQAAKSGHRVEKIGDGFSTLGMVRSPRLI
jgi:hypothetical protein